MQQRHAHINAVFHSLFGTMLHWMLYNVELFHGSNIADEKKKK
jgi:hypothetical protein